VGRLERHETAATGALANEQLDTLPGAVTQVDEDRTGEVGEREPVGGSPAQGDQAGAEGIAALAVPAHQTVVLERAEQAMSGGSGQAGPMLHVGQRGGALVFESAEYGNGLVDNTDTG